jgi:hypothetical protein
MRLADTGWTEKDNVLGALDEGQAGEFMDLLARRAGEAPSNWWTPLLSSDGSGKVSNEPGTASFYG